MRRVRWRVTCKLLQRGSFWNQPCTAVVYPVSALKRRLIASPPLSLWPRGCHNADPSHLRGLQTLARYCFTDYWYTPQLSNYLLLIVGRVYRLIVYSICFRTISGGHRKYDLRWTQKPIYVSTFYEPHLVLFTMVSRSSAYSAYNLDRGCVNKLIWNILLRVGC